MKPAIGANAWLPLPKVVDHCPTTSFWKFTTPGPLTTWSASEIADSATKCAWAAPRKLRVASTFTVPTSSALATIRRSVAMAKSATASTKPDSPGRLGRVRRYRVIPTAIPYRLPSARLRIATSELT